MSLLRARLSDEWPLPFLVLIAATAGLILGTVSLATTAIDEYAAPALGLLALALYLLARSKRKYQGARDRNLENLMKLALGAALVLLVLPPYLYATDRTPSFYGVIHRSVVSALLLVGLSLPALSAAVFHLFGQGPEAEDLSRYPMLIFPSVVVLALYGLILSSGLVRGMQPLIKDPAALVRPYVDLEPGLGRHISGSLILVALTAIISLPVGVGTGVFLAEYATGLVKQWITTTTTALRSISVFILGLGAMYAARYATGTFLSDLLTGYSVFGTERVSGHGTYITAALFLSLLVIPIIARAAEEGCRTLPHDLREGSWALAASEGYTLRRVILPWAWPNIVTALLLGCAEVAGSVAVVMFVAYTSDEPHRLLNRPSVLSHLAYELGLGRHSELQAYTYSAAFLIVLFTMGLNIAALVLKNRYAARHRGNP